MASEHLKNYVKHLFTEAGITILPDMKVCVEARRGRSICAKTFKLERADANVDGVKKLLESSTWKAFAIYTVEEWEGNLFVRGHAE